MWVGLGLNGHTICGWVLVCTKWSECGWVIEMDISGRGKSVYL